MLKAEEPGHLERLLERERRGILERKLGPDAEELADIHVAWAWIRFRQGRLAESKEAWSEALRIRTLHPGTKKVELQKVLVGLSQVALSQRDFAGARESLNLRGAYLEVLGDLLGSVAVIVAAVVILLTWFLLSAYAVLIGAEINAEMERQAPASPTP